MIICSASLGKHVPITAACNMVMIGRLCCPTGAVISTLRQWYSTWPHRLIYRISSLCSSTWLKCCTFPLWDLTPQPATPSPVGLAFSAISAIRTPSPALCAAASVKRYIIRFDCYVIWLKNVWFNMVIIWFCCTNNPMRDNLVAHYIWCP